MNNLHLLTDEEIREALAEVLQLRSRLDAIEVRRSEVEAAMEELDDLDLEVTKRSKVIRQHLRDAL